MVGAGQSVTDSMMPEGVEHHALDRHAVRPEE